MIYHELLEFLEGDIVYIYSEDFFEIRTYNSEAILWN